LPQCSPIADQILLVVCCLLFSLQNRTCATSFSSV
jgi:hypothetical protein